MSIYRECDVYISQFAGNELGRTLDSAAGDLFHFAIVFGAVFGLFVVMGYVFFSAKVEQFSSLAWSLQTCAFMVTRESGILFLTNFWAVLPLRK